MINSLRYRFLGWLLIFALLITCMIIPSSILRTRRENNISSVVKEINSLYISFLKLFRSSDNFFYSEPVNPRFFISGESKVLDNHQDIAESLKERIIDLNSTSNKKSFDINHELYQVIDEFSDYEMIFDSLVYLVYKKGYKNFGVEGEMIHYIYRLENNIRLDKTKILQIRRNEKDYFLRNDKFYIENFNRLTQNLKSSIIRNPRISSDDKKTIIYTLDNYISAFHLLVKLDRQIGLRDNSGLRHDLIQKCRKIESLLTTLESKSIVTQQALIRKSNIYYAFFIGLVIILSITVSYFLSKHMVIHLEALTNYISNLTRNNFVYVDKLNLRKSATEIRQIYKEFRNMVARLRVWEKERDKALKNAEDNERRYRELADMLPQSIYETNELGNFTYVNKAWHETFGYTNEDLGNGLNLIETIISKTNDDILGHHKIENSNFIAIRKDGTNFPASVYSHNIIKGDKLCGRRGIIIDITARDQYISSLKKETDKAQTADKLKSSFLANMSHEIRTPMNSIIGFSNLISSDEIPDNQKGEFAGYIKSSGELLLNLIDDIIDIAKIEAGEIKIDKKECNVFKLFSELEYAFKDDIRKSDKKNLKLIFDKSSPENLVTKTDPYRLRQIISNLLNNAIKFTETGAINFGFKINDDKTLKLYVRDTGVGLSRDELKIIFERFKRTNTTEEKNIVGTGLGLTISKNLVELLGGDMWVDSSPGLGTTFYFTIPYLKVSGTVDKYSFNKSLLKNFNWENISILIVEDDEPSYSFLKEILRKTNANVIRARDASTAIDICKSNMTIDIVLMDIQLPEMDGYEATREIKKVRKSLPVIAQTAYAMAGDKEKSILAGCDDYITKPIKIKNLLPKINQFIADKIKPVQRSGQNSKTKNPAADKKLS